MKISVSRYTHEPIPKMKCEGAVLRVQFGGWLEGFADLHPWTAYGDAALEEQLALLEKNRASLLISKALHFAFVDARARRASRNLLLGLNLPPSHALVNNEAEYRRCLAQGYRHFKVKVSGSEDLSRYSEGRLRLDFGGQWKFADFSAWWNKCPVSVRVRIDVIEDAWNDEGDFSQPRLLYGDWLENSLWCGKVFKPARDFSFLQYSAARFGKVLFTHGLDHPLGQMAALWEAGRFYRRYPSLFQAGGFSCANEKEFQPFYETWNVVGPVRKAAPGLGFGFDGPLRDLRWERVL